MILIVHCGSSKVPYIEEAVDQVCDYRTVPLLDLKPEDTTQCAGIIISGAPILLTETDHAPFLHAVSWLKTYTRPVLGICFGHQLIGLTFGASVSRQKDDRDLQTIEQLYDSMLFNRLPHEFEMLEDHCETISIPPGFRLTATSDSCVNEAMEHLEKPLFGVQFHPETSGNHGYLLLANFVEYCLEYKPAT